MSIRQISTYLRPPGKSRFLGLNAYIQRPRQRGLINWIVVDELTLPDDHILMHLSPRPPIGTKLSRMDEARARWRAASDALIQYRLLPVESPLFQAFPSLARRLFGESPTLHGRSMDLHPYIPDPRAISGTYLMARHPNGETHIYQNGRIVKVIPVAGLQWVEPHPRMFQSHQLFR